MLTTLAQFNETQSDEAFVLQNSQIVKVRLGEGAVRTVVGNAVAWQGNVDFGEVGDDGLRGITGTGEVFLSDTAKHVHLIQLENEAIRASAEHLLAFEQGVDWEVLEDAGIGAFELRGTGWLAVVSFGTPLLLNAGAAPTFTSSRAAVAWSSGVEIAPADRGLGFSGEGWVLVQPAG